MKRKARKEQKKEMNRKGDDGKGASPRSVSLWLSRQASVVRGSAGLSAVPIPTSSHRQGEAQCSARSHSKLRRPLTLASCCPSEEPQSIFCYLSRSPPVSRQQAPSHPEQQGRGGGEKATCSQTRSFPLPLIAGSCVSITSLFHNQPAPPDPLTPQSCHLAFGELRNYF